MKMRIGLVSNSSSSSFSVYGIELERKEAEPYVIKARAVPFIREAAERVAKWNDWTDEITSEEGFTEFLKEVGTEFLCELGVLDEDDYFYFGLNPWYGMRDDETKAEFIVRVEALIREVFGESHAKGCDYHSAIVYG